MPVSWRFRNLPKLAAQRSSSQSDFESDKVKAKKLPEMENVVKLDISDDLVNKSETPKPPTSETPTDTEFVDCESESGSLNRSTNQPNSEL